MFNNKEILEHAGFGKLAARYSMYWDLIVVTAVILLFSAVVPISTTLMVGDWDFFIDWRDRQFWPLVFPIVAIWYCAALGAAFWKVSAFQLAAPWQRFSCCSASGWRVG